MQARHLTPLALLAVLCYPCVGRVVRAMPIWLHNSANCMVLAGRWRRLLLRLLHVAVKDAHDLLEKPQACVAGAWCPGWYAVPHGQFLQIELGALLSTHGTGSRSWRT